MAYNLVTNGLVACWDASDWTSGTTWTDNIAGKVLTFSSAPSSKTTDGIELTTSITFTSASLASLGVSYPCTFEWLGRIDGTWSSSSPGNIFGLGTANGNWSGCIQAYAQSSSSYGVSLDLESSKSISSKVNTSGIEYHILVTVNSSGTTTLYVNSTTAKGTSSNSVGTNNKYYLSNSEGSGRFYGAISRMALWNTCLSSTEIETLFSEASTANTYTVTSTITGGTISSENPVTVEEGNSTTISFTGNSGYTFSSMTVGGTSVTPTSTAASTTTATYSTNYGTYSTYALDNCHDGDTSTLFWSSEAQATGKYILISFDNAINLTSFSTYSSSSTDYPNTCNILQVSTDGGSTWTNIGTFSNSQTSTFSNITTANGINAIRIYANSTITNWLVLNTITMVYTVVGGTQYSYTIDNITEDKTVDIIFTQSSSGGGSETTTTHIVTSSITNGSLTSSTPITVNDGESTTITFTGTSGFYFASMTINGVSVSPVSKTVNSNTTYSYDITNITEDKTVIVTFDSTIRYTVSMSISGGTLVSPTTKSMYIEEGSNAVINFIANANYAFSNMSVNGTDVTPTLEGSNYTYTIENVTSAETVIIVFQKQAVSTDTLYFKNGTVWNAVKAVYQKVNGTWVLTTFTHSDNTKYVHRTS